MKNISIWKDSVKIKNFSSLKQNKDLDVLIIGGGITGISTLYNLSKTNLKVMLVEQNKIGESATGNSTGKLTYLQNDLLIKIKNIYDESILVKYINSQKESIKKLIQLIKDNNFSCDLEKVDSFLYTNKEDEVLQIKEIERILINNKIKVYHDKINHIKYKYSINVKDTYQINPLKLLNCIVETDNYNIYEKTSNVKIEKEENKYICYTNNNKRIIAKYIVLASSYPYFLNSNKS